MQPIKVPIAIWNYVKHPKAPAISFGENSLTIKGTIDENIPTTNPWKNRHIIIMGNFYT